MPNHLTKNLGLLGQFNGANSEFDLSLRRETTALRACFFWFFCMKLGLHTTSMTTKKNFGQNNFLAPKMAKNGQNFAIFGQNSHFWVFLAYNFQTPLWIFLIFGMEVFLMVFFEKIILFMPGKFWYGEILAILRPKFGQFCPK